MRVFTESEIKDLKARYFALLDASRDVARTGRLESAERIAATAEPIAIVLAAVIRTEENRP